MLFENNNNPYDERRLFVNLCLQKAKHVQPIHENLLIRAQEIEKEKIKGLDTLHLACAEELKVDYFLTCDDKILKRYNGIVKLQDPVDFVLNFLKEEQTNDS